MLACSKCFFRKVSGHDAFGRMTAFPEDQMAELVRHDMAQNCGERGVSIAGQLLDAVAEDISDRVQRKTELFPRAPKLGGHRFVEKHDVQEQVSAVGVWG